MQYICINQYSINIKTIIKAIKLSSQYAAGSCVTCEAGADAALVVNCSQISVLGIAFERLFQSCVNAHAHACKI